MPKKRTPPPQPQPARQRFLSIEPTVPGKNGGRLRPGANSGPDVPGIAPAIVQALARQAFHDEAIPVLRQVLRQELFKYRRTILDRVTGQLRIEEGELRPEIGDVLKAADILGKYGRLNQLVVTDGAGQPVDAWRQDIAERLVEALDRVG